MTESILTNEDQGMMDETINEVNETFERAMVAAEQAEEAIQATDEARAPKTRTVTKIIRPTLRSMEELNSVSVKALTDPEMRKYIEYLRNENALVKESALQFQANCDSAYAQLRGISQEYDAYRVSAEQKLMYVQNSVQNLHASLALIGKGNR